MSEPWTVRRMIRWIQDDLAPRGIASARLDAELIVAHALGVDRVKLYLDLDRPLDPAELATIRGLVARRRKREPIAYLRGRREFYGRDFVVSPAVLVPRPETETLVERALAMIGGDRAARVLDLCTGSGCIGLTLAAERPSWSVTLTDLSEDALAVARANAEALGVVDRVALCRGDLFDAIDSGAQPFDLVVANPPYIATSERASLAPDVRDFEPSLALFAEEDGLALVRRIASGAPAWIANAGALLVEIGAGQGENAREALGAAGLQAVVVHRDLAGRDRVVEGHRA